MFKWCVFLILSFFCMSCSFHARNKDYQGALRRSTKKMLSVDFVEMIVENEEELVEDFVVLSKEQARIYEERNIKQDKKRPRIQKYYMTKNESGEWIYIKE